MIHSWKQLCVYGEPAVQLIAWLGHQPHGKFPLEHQHCTPALSIRQVCIDLSVREHLHHPNATRIPELWCDLTWRMVGEAATWTQMEMKSIEDKSRVCYHSRHCYVTFLRNVNALFLGIKSKSYFKDYCFIPDRASWPRRHQKMAVLFSGRLQSRSAALSALVWNKLRFVCFFNVKYGKRSIHLWQNWHLRALNSLLKFSNQSSIQLTCYNLTRQL